MLHRWLPGGEIRTTLHTIVEEPTYRDDMSDEFAPMCKLGGRALCRADASLK